MQRNGSVMTKANPMDDLRSELAVKTELYKTAAGAMSMGSVIAGIGAWIAIGFGIGLMVMGGGVFVAGALIWKT